MGNDSSIQADEDVRLMMEVMNGDHHAYTRLYEKYAPLVRKYLSRRDGQPASSDDLVQEVFARVWSGRTRYRLGPVRSYLLGICANVIRENRTRTRGRIPIQIVLLDALPDTRRLGPPAQVQSAERSQTVRALMSRLPTRQRQVLELVYLAGLTPGEAARQLGCSIQTFYSHLCKARQTLRSLDGVPQEDHRNAHFGKGSSHISHS